MSSVVNHVKLVQTTQDPEANMAYIARVSNPAGQAAMSPSAARLLKYCIAHGHWSVFEHAYMTLELTTTVAIATQLLRHRSFVFQQFSQRYASPSAALPTTFVAPHLRMQDTKNRQNSLDSCPPDVQAHFQARMQALLSDCRKLYDDMLQAGVAKECARGILPQCTVTRVEMTGNCRSWIHYIQLRTGPETQAEHRQLACAIQLVFCSVFPTVAQALGWSS